MLDNLRTLRSNGASNMKIVIVTPYYFPVLGGYTLITHALLKEYSEKGHDVYILTPECDQEHKGENVHTFVSRTLSSKEKSGILDGMTFLERMFGHKEMTSVHLDMVKKIQKIRPDIVHTFGAIQFGFVGALSSRSSSLWVHTMITQPPHKINFIKKLMVKKVFKRSDLITSTARSQIEDLKDKYGMHVDKAITVGVDTTFFTPSSEPPKSLSMGAVSNFVWKEKVEGLLLLIRAFEKVINDFPEARLKIVGDGEYRKRVKDTINDHGLKDHVLLLGSLDRDRLSVFYKNISVFVHISFQDTLPLTVLEAMASGLPVVASRTGDIPDVVTRDVGIVAGLDEGSIANSLKSLMKSQKNREDLGEAARTKVEKEYSWPKVAEKYLREYQKIISSREKRPGK
jgi:glycosyltransferase involved in cell wall biosynthesis